MVEVVFQICDIFLPADPSATSSLALLTPPPLFGLNRGSPRLAFPATASWRRFPIVRGRLPCRRARRSGPTARPTPPRCPSSNATCPGSCVSSNRWEANECRRPVVQPCETVLVFSGNAYKHFEAVAKIGRHDGAGSVGESNAATTHAAPGEWSRAFVSSS